jgi:hypothetical protein
MKKTIVTALFVVVLIGSVLELCSIRSIYYHIYCIGLSGGILLGAALKHIKIAEHNKINKKVNKLHGSKR